MQKPCGSEIVPVKIAAQRKCGSLGLDDCASANFEPDEAHRSRGTGAAETRSSLITNSEVALEAAVEAIVAMTKN